MPYIFAAVGIRLGGKGSGRDPLWMLWVGPGEGNGW